MTSAILLRNTRIILISLAAGSIDASSYLGLGHVFVANMTGNTVLLALALGGEGSGLSVLRNGVSLVAFAIGALAGAAFVSLRIDRRKKVARAERAVGDERAAREMEEWPKEVNSAICVEALILIIFGIAWSSLSYGQSPSSGELLTYVLISLSAVAMGLQSVAISHLGIWGVVTTYITGTYTSFLVGIVRRVSGQESLLRYGIPTSH